MATGNLSSTIKKQTSTNEAFWFKKKQEVEITYNRAFLTPLFALIKTLRDI